MPRPIANYESNPPAAGLQSRQTALSRYLAPLKPGRSVLLWGEHLRPLAAAAAAWGAARSTPVLVVDAANRFDPYGLVREARGRDLAPRETLAKVRVARAFTCHQLVRLVEEILPPALTPGCLVIVLGPVSLFYDEQVPLAERRRLFRDLTNLLGRIKSQAALLLLQPLMSREASNRHFGKLLAPMLDYLVEVGGRMAGQDQTPPPDPRRLQRGDLKSERLSI